MLLSGMTLCGCSIEYIAPEPAAVSTEETTEEITGEVIEEITEESIIPTPRKTEPTSENVEVRSTAKTNEFYYSRLDENSQKLYSEVLYILSNMVDGSTVSTLDIEELDRVFLAVMNDHPEIFYVDGYTCTTYKSGDRIKKLKLGSQYTYSSDYVEKCRERIESYMQQVREAFKEEYPNGADDYHTIKFAYDYVITNTDYEKGAPDNQNILSVMFGHKSVCQGYAKTIQYILNDLGIEATLVSGKNVEDGAAHAWNLVKSDGEYYYLDATWGDPSYSVTMTPNAENMTLPSIDYEFFLMNDDQIALTHIVDNRDSLPLCDALKDNYYIHENLYFDSVDEKHLSEVFTKACNEKLQYITLKCSDEVSYKEMWKYLIEDGNIFTYFSNETRTVSYGENPEHLYFIFWL